MLGVEVIVFLTLDKTVKPANRKLLPSCVVVVVGVVLCAVTVVGALVIFGVVIFGYFLVVVCTIIDIAIGRADDVSSRQRACLTHCDVFPIRVTELVLRDFANSVLEGWEGAQDLVCERVAMIVLKEFAEVGSSDNNVVIGTTTSASNLLCTLRKPMFVCVCG